TTYKLVCILSTVDTPFVKRTPDLPNGAKVSRAERKGLSGALGRWFESSLAKAGSSVGRAKALLPSDHMLSLNSRTEVDGLSLGDINHLHHTSSPDFVSR